MTDTMLMVRAREFALKMHGSQKYGKRPYGVHLKAVAEKVRAWGGSDELVAAAWLHDVIEDTMDPLEIPDKCRVIDGRFGRSVERIVTAVTSVGATRDEGTRNTLKNIDGFFEAALLKAADRWCNMTAVADDLEFMTVDDSGYERLVRIGEMYLSEFANYMPVFERTIRRSSIIDELHSAFRHLSAAVQGS